MVVKTKIEGGGGVEFIVLSIYSFGSLAAVIYSGNDQTLMDCRIVFI